MRPAHQESAASNAAARLRMLLWLHLGALAAFGLTDLVLAPETLLPLWALKAAQAAVIGAAFRALRRGVREPRTARRWGLLDACVSLTCTLLSGAAIGDPFSTPVIAGLVALLVPSLLEFEAREQAVLVAVALACLGGLPLLVPGALGYVWLASASTVVASFFLTAILARQRAEVRRALAAEHAALEARRAEAHLSAALARAGNEIIDALAQGNLAQRLCGLTADLLDSDASCLLRLGSANGTATVLGAHARGPVADGVRSGTRFPIAELPVDAACLGEGEVWEREAPATGPRPPWTERLGGRRVLLAPLRRGEEVLGILVAVRDSNPRPWSGNERRLLAGLARLGSLALEVTRLLGELRRTNAELRESNTVKTYLAATMSHELRNTLTAVMGYAAILRDQLAGGGTAGRADMALLDRLRRLAEHGSHVIRVCLELSRAEAARSPEEGQQQTVAAEQILAELAEELRPQAGRSAARLEWTAGKALPPVRTDPVKLRMIVENLVTNALKFTESGSVRVTARAVDGGLEIAVADTGRGIPEEEIPFLFEPFRQAHGAVSREAGGAGLGLFIVRRLCDLIGARLAVESEPGRGTTFRLWMPAAGAGAPGGRAEARASSAGRARVLVVDDEPMNRYLLRRMLQRLGHDVAEAGNGAEALAALDREGFQFVFTDLQMPGMDGFELCRTARERLGGGCPVFVAVTGSSGGPETRERCRSAGFAEILQKPPSPESLRGILAARRSPARPSPWPDPGGTGGA